MTREEKSKKVAEFEARECSFAIPSDPGVGNGELKIVIRCVRAAFKEASPAVTVLVNASGIQGIQHED